MQAAGLRVVANSPIRRVLNNPSEELGAAGVSAAGPWPMRGLCVRARVGAVGVPISFHILCICCVSCVSGVLVRCVRCVPSSPACMQSAPPPLRCLLHALCVATRIVPDPVA